MKSCLAAAALSACANSEPAGDPTGDAGTSGGSAGVTGSGGTGGSGPGVGGTTGAAGAIGSGGSGSGSAGSSGSTGSAGATGAAGSIAGAAGATGTAGQGGATGAAGSGSTGRGGASGAAGATGTAGRGGTGGGAGSTGLAGRGGSSGGAGTSGGRGGTTGGSGGATGGSGGATGSAGTTGAGGAVEIDCNAAMPTGGTMRSSNNASGTAGGLAWTIWTNSGPGTITYFTNAPAFAASWNGSGDFLARLGLQWNNTKTYDQYGTITAQYTQKKTGSGGGYSYIGMYGWSTNPCVEFYIVDDSYNRMPVNPGNTTNKGTVTIDGAPYIMYTRNTTGTGGSKCGSSVNNWVQYYSVRMTARTCGQISLTEHFKAWANLGMTLGKMDQAQMLVETGGGTGSIEFPIAQMSATMP